MWARLSSLLDSLAQKDSIQIESRDQSDCVALESRVLYSAQPLGDLADGKLSEGDAFEHDAVNLDADEIQTAGLEQLATPGPEALDAEGVESVPSSGLWASEDSDVRTPVADELVVVDGSVEDYETLLNDLLSTRSEANVEVLVVESDSDGVREITSALRRHSSLAAVHILAHGNSRGLRLGATQLDLDQLDAHAGAIASWASAFADGGDLLIYGCNLAESAEGQELVEALASLTLADVAASDDVTGSSDVAGDWSLEYVSGEIASSRVFYQSDVASWSGSLDLITVTTTADLALADTGVMVGDLDPSANPISLREAIVAANNTPGADEIVLSAGTYVLTINGGDELAHDGDLDITSELIIRGTDPANTIIEAQNNNRVFEIRPSAVATIEGVTITGGSVDDSGGGGLEVHSSAQLTLRDVVVSGNATVHPQDGGGIYNDGSMNLIDTTIASNSAARDGGGLYNSGTATLERVTFSGNTGEEGGGIHQNNGLLTGTDVVINGSNRATSGRGGGIDNSNSTIDITNITISGNHSTNGGGGINNDGGSSMVTLTNITVSGNSTDGDGGGIRTREPISILNGTIADNTATGVGGGLEIGGGKGDISLLNTILDNNSSSSGLQNVEGTATSLGHNIDSDGTAGLSQTGDQSSVDPLLDVLADNGGFVQTHNLLPGSPGVDAGSASGAPLTDVLGNLRDAVFDLGPIETSALTAPPPVASDDAYNLDEDSTLDTAADWFDNDWLVRQRLVFNNIDQTTALSDFPVLVTLDSSIVDYAALQVDAADLRFVDGDGTLLDHEIEAWNPSGESRVWVRVPQIDGSSDSDYIWMYYGNAAATSIESPQAVWGANYRAVYHLNDDLNDSTSNGVNPNASESTSAAGYIGDGELFDGTDDFINLGSSAPINNLYTGGGTVSAWFNATSFGESDNGRILNKATGENPNPGGWNFGITGLFDRVEFEFGFSGGEGRWFAGINSIQLDTWHHVVVSFDSASDSNLPTFYVDGQQLSTIGSLFDNPNGNAVSDAGQDLAIGNLLNGLTRSFDGTIDEVRLENGIRSADEVAADYLSASNQFISFERDDLLANDADAGTSTTTLVSGPSSSANFQLRTNGHFLYEPSPDFVGTDSFDYRVSNGSSTSVGTVTLTVNGVNDPPQLVANNALTVLEGGPAPIDSSVLSYSDVDDSSSDLIYTVLSGPTNGQLELVSDAGNAITTFTQADIDSGDVQFVHNGEEPAAEGFSFEITDGDVTLSETFTINVNQVNDEPTVSGNDFSVAEGGSFDLTANELLAQDIEQTADQLTYTVTTLPLRGQFERKSLLGTATTSFTQDEVDNDQIVYVHDGSEEATDAFTFSLSDGSATLTDLTRQISVTPVNDLPQLVTNDPLGANEGERTVLDSTVLEYFDADDAASDVVYTLVSGPTNGQLELGSDPGVVVITFTQSDIDSGDLEFVHNGAEPAAEGFTFSVTDGGTPLSGSFTINVAPVNDPPTLSGNDLSLAEGGTLILTTNEFLAQDVEQAATELTYTVTAAPSQGQLERVASFGNPITFFTQQEVLDGNIVYVHDGSEQITDSFSFSLFDGEATLNGSRQVAISPVNDAPLLDNSSPFQLGPVLANAADPSGRQVDQIVASVGGDPLTDVDGDPEGVAVVGVDNSNGVWEYSINGGTSWVSFASVGVSTSGADETNGLLLADTDWIRFVPNAAFVGNTGDLNFRAWDQTAGTSGDANVDTSYSAIGPFSSNLASAFGIVQSTNPDAVDDSLTVSEGQAGSVEVTLNDVIADSPLAPTTVTIVVGGDPANGSATVTPTGSIVYTHDGSETTTDLIRYTVEDTDGDVSDVATVFVTIDPINDAPAASGTDFSVDEGATFDLSGSLSASDDDHTSSELVDSLGRFYSFTNGPSSGHFEDALGAVISTFTQQQVAAGDVFYVHDGSETTLDSFEFTVSDGSLSTSLQTVNITINPINDSPIANVSDLMVDEGGVALITLQSSDAESSVEQLTWTVTSSPSFGRFELDDAGPITTFTQGQIDAGRVSYVHDGSEDTAGLIGLTLTDDDGGGVMGLTMNVVVTAVNDAPILSGPSDQLLVENTVLQFAPATIGTFAIADEDAGANPMRLTIDVADGVVSLPSMPTLAYVTGDGTDDGFLVVEGIQADLNAALAGLVFTPNLDFLGTATVTVTIEDIAGGHPAALQDSGVLSIIVDSVPDAVEDYFEVTENTGSFSGTLVDNDIYDSAISASLVSAPSVGSVVVDPDGSFTFISSNATGLTTFEYAIENVNGFRDTAVVEINILAPIIPIITSNSDSEAPASESVENSEDEASTGDIVAPLVATKSDAVTQAKSRDARSRSVAEVGEEVQVIIRDQAETKQESAEEARDRSSLSRAFVRDVGVWDQPETTATESAYDVLRFELGAFMGLDNLSEEISSNVVGWHSTSMAVVSSGTAVGWAIWSLRSSYVAASLISTVSPWILVDPLPVLDDLEKSSGNQKRDKKKDDLETMMERG